MSQISGESQALFSGTNSVPVTVWIAGCSIIATRCLGVLLLANELGYEELLNLIHRSAQAWGSTLIFIASLLVWLTELRSAIALLRGHNWGRWVFLTTQVLVLAYMFSASAGWIYPELFSIVREHDAQILPSLLLDKSPDLLVLLLLFVPASSRRFFR
ncbi:YbjO family protein [Erwinia tasmaniensis]|uniref:Inner membrane protein n=1 Tax=Erwinia tasmaniensis (strain DSM 17950 / CFBP 7177 / CIP 109463 / NCPPB 4357 / Et1/99) TaxID=465817 RepID=B2VC41_ERWT9|nr:YbjO family protein [Erwinia tasmaniensis]CAO97219.1 Inner membrane protein [Erwinia tasmaniensis Et1/99]